MAGGIVVLEVVLERDGPGSGSANQYQPERKRVAFIVSMIAGIQCAAHIPECRRQGLPDLDVGMRFIDDDARAAGL